MNLLIFKVNQLGDNVVFLPVVQMFRRLHPDWKVTVFTSPVAAPLYQADIDPDQLVEIPTAAFNGAWKDPRKLWQLYERVRQSAANATLLANDQGNVAHLLALTAGGKVRVGVKQPFVKVPHSLTDAAFVENKTPAAMINWHVAKRLLGQFSDQAWPDAPPAPGLFHLTKGIQPSAGRVVIHSGASQSYQRWFPERFVELANRLSKTLDVLWIDQGFAEEMSLLPEIRRMKPASLQEFVQVLASANLLVANNSGPMNLAAALGCPAVIINGPSNPIWDPFWNPERYLMLRDLSVLCVPCDAKIQPAMVCTNLENPMACMKAWPVSTVEMRCREWLERWPVEKLKKQPVDSF